MTRIGINGFGRIGTAVTRIALERSDIELVRINDPAPLPVLAHLLAHDSVHGHVEGVRAEDKEIHIGDRVIPFSAERSPEAIDWSDCDVVLECSGVFRSREGAQRFIDSGAPYLLISAPASDPDATIVVGVNDDLLDLQHHRIIYNASCTTNCLAPVAKVLHSKLGIEQGLMTTVHAYTNDQRVLDTAHKDLRRARAAAINMIPTTTGAATAVGLVLPELAGKLQGLSVRVPVADVSLVDLVAAVGTRTSVEEVNALLRDAAATGPLMGILATSDEPLVSSDYIGCPASSTVDTALTHVVDGTLIKVIAWYDNEWGFSNRMLDLATRFTP